MGEERESFLRSSLMDQVSGEERESFLRSSLMDQVSGGREGELSQV